VPATRSLPTTSPTKEIREYGSPFLGALREPGLIQLWTGIVARTAPGWSLLVRAPANVPRSGSYELFEGIIETDRWFGPLITNVGSCAPRGFRRQESSRPRIVRRVGTRNENCKFRQAAAAHSPLPALPLPAAATRACRSGSRQRPGGHARGNAIRSSAHPRRRGPLRTRDRRGGG
jgi:hypothetical protein